MKLFSNPLAFVAFLGVLAVEVDHEKFHALELAAKIVEKESKRVLGTDGYNWPALSPDTKKTQPGMLLETGEMRDSIEHTVSHDKAEIGSNLDKAVFQEWGTSTIPPRPFLAGALNEKSAEIVSTIGQDIVATIRGKKS